MPRFMRTWLRERQHLPQSVEGRPAWVPEQLPAADLARVMGVDAGRVSRLINARTSVTGDTALRLAEALGTSAEFWMRLQADYDLAQAREARVA